MLKDGVLNVHLPHFPHSGRLPYRVVWAATCFNSIDGLGIMEPAFQPAWNHWFFVPAIYDVWLVWAELVRSLWLNPPSLGENPNDSVHQLLLISSFLVSWCFLYPLMNLSKPFCLLPILSRALLEDTPSYFHQPPTLCYPLLKSGMDNKSWNSWIGKTWSSLPINHLLSNNLFDGW